VGPSREYAPYPQQQQPAPAQQHGYGPPPGHRGAPPPPTPRGYGAGGAASPPHASSGGYGAPPHFQQQQQRPGYPGAEHAASPPRTPQYGNYGSSAQSQPPSHAGAAYGQPQSQGAHESWCIVFRVLESKVARIGRWSARRCARDSGTTACLPCASAAYLNRDGPDEIGTRDAPKRLARAEPSCRRTVGHEKAMKPLHAKRSSCRERQPRDKLHCSRRLLACSSPSTKLS
jgi:hypothetical protein